MSRSAYNGAQVGGDENPFALSVGDLMAALLLVFVLLLSATLLLIKEDEVRTVSIIEEYEALLLLIKENEVRTVSIIEEYEALQDSLYQDLLDEFAGDLERWDAELDRSTLALRFREPEVLFERGRADVRPAFAAILSDFFPRYVGILRRDEYRSSIEEIRIEGHTSSEWATGAGADVSYFNNMQLSQDRTRSVLQKVLNTIPQGAERSWTRRLVTANGLSSSQPVLVNGMEDPRSSRRVEFRVRTDAERQLREILDQFKGRTAEASTATETPSEEPAVDLDPQSLTNR